MSSREELHELYWGQGLTIPQIAKRLGLSSTSVWVAMKSSGIKRRRCGPRGPLGPRILTDDQRLNRAAEYQRRHQEARAVEEAKKRRALQRWREELAHRLVAGGAVARGTESEETR